MITTIQLTHGTKMALAKLKDRNETYEEVICKLINKAKNDNVLKQGYVEMNQHTKEINAKWSTVDSEWK